jgi:endonuclease/exonuclease/phosphatase family metal-dependent hydrolase
MEASISKYDAVVSISTPNPVKESIRIMTYNIRRGLGIEGVLKLDAIISIIKEVDPDIVVLNEVDHLMPRSLMQKQDEIIAKKLGYNAIYGYNLNLISKYGNALFTKHTIKEWTNTTLPSRKGVFVEPRGVIEAVINIRGKELNVLATHLSLNQNDRILQTEFITERLKQGTAPKLLLGDFNARPTSVEVQEILLVMKDGTDIDAKTYPAKEPEAKIDYIFVSNDIEISEGRLIKREVSDHLPVVVDIVLE